MKLWNCPKQKTRTEFNINKFSILLIDDDEDDYINLRDLFAEITGVRFQVTWKSSYHEGLKALKEGGFDACLLDYRLGANTGIELLHEIQKLDIRCPTILLTGQGDFDIDVQAMQIGAADYLIKAQLTAPLLERSIRYSIKHAMDMEELRQNKAQILQQDRLASLGLLASSLAHEIGTPLGIIRSRAELAEKKTDNSGVKQDMQTIVSQIDRIAKLVNSLLHLARDSKSDFSTSVNLKNVVQDILNFVHSELIRKNIKFVLDLKSDLQVMAEAGPLGQVLLNLLVNAVHAIEEADKNISHTISLRAEDKGSTVRICVQDTGTGISEDNISQIFKPFFTTKEIGRGTGLGLATSYKLVHSWGGSLSVQSKVGEGSTFTIVLLKPG